MVGMPSLAASSAKVKPTPPVAGLMRTERNVPSADAPSMESCSGVICETCNAPKKTPADSAAASVIVRVPAALTSRIAWSVCVCSGALRRPLSMRNVFPPPNAISRPSYVVIRAPLVGDTTRTSLSCQKPAESRAPMRSVYATLPSGVQAGNGPTASCSLNWPPAPVTSVTNAEPRNRLASTYRIRSPRGDHCGAAMLPSRPRLPSSRCSRRTSRTSPVRSVAQMSPPSANVVRATGPAWAGVLGNERAIDVVSGYHASGCVTSVRRTTGRSGCAVS